MISQEMQNQIKGEAIEHLKSWITVIDTYTTAATKYAEKVEERDKEIAGKDKEIAELKAIITEFEKIALKDEVHFDKFQAQLESHKHRGDKGFEAAKFYQAQLAQLKEIADGMITVIREYVQSNYDIKAISLIHEMGKRLITSYAEWCKQNN